MNGSPAGSRAHGPVFNEGWKSHERARPSEMSGKEVLPDICGNVRRVRNVRAAAIML